MKTNARSTLPVSAGSPAAPRLLRRNFSNVKCPRWRKAPIRG